MDGIKTTHTTNNLFHGEQLKERSEQNHWTPAPCSGTKRSGFKTLFFSCRKNSKRSAPLKGWHFNTRHSAAGFKRERRTRLTSGNWTSPDQGGSYRISSKPRLFICVFFFSYKSNPKRDCAGLLVEHIKTLGLVKAGDPRRSSCLKISSLWFNAP